MMLTVTIDGGQVKVKEGATILEAAATLGIEIPTLCNHEALTPYGACRLCTVEIRSGAWSRLETACTYPVWEGLEVLTDSERVVKARKFIIELLLARCPGSKELLTLANRLGVYKCRLKKQDEKEKCILCGLCVRTCRELIGASAISFINRGIDRKVDTPFQIDSDACIGCGACAFVCPTGVISIKDIEGKRKIDTWQTELELARCKDCGERFTTLKGLKRIREKLGLPDEIFERCGACKRKKARADMASSKI